jgi:hypothetical protein
VANLPPWIISGRIDGMRPRKSSSYTAQRQLAKKKGIMPKKGKRPTPLQVVRGSAHLKEAGRKPGPMPIDPKELLRALSVAGYW